MTVRLMGVVMEGWVSVGNTGLSCRVSRCGVRGATGYKMSVLELRTPRLLCRQLQLNEHHVIANTQCQGEGGTAGQEVTDLQ